VNWIVLVSVLVMTAVTFGLRALPFLALREIADTPVVRFVGAVMPPGVLVILVANSLSTVDVSLPPYGVPAALAVLVTAALHHWRRNALLSIVGGTAVYMLLLRLLS
jgi:branched-subunit amino acid transport protein AzlD